MSKDKLEMTLEEIDSLLTQLLNKIDSHFDYHSQQITETFEDFKKNLNDKHQVNEVEE